MNSTSPISFLKKNWSNVISLLLSLAALIVALQANSYARQSTTPNLVITDYSGISGLERYTGWSLELSGCYSENGKSYGLKISTSGHFWISNNGGLDATLVAVNFASDLDNAIIDLPWLRWSVGMFEGPPSGPGKYIPELHVPSGSTESLRVDATHYRFFPTKEAALNYADSFTAEHTGGKLEEGRWYFRFGNGTTLIYPYSTSTSWIKLGSSLEEQFETSCS